jgi:ectoine hydroxylase-related dioxygenase (phytanoyl-CoA dioxygenase family)
VPDLGPPAAASEALAEAGYTIAEAVLPQSTVTALQEEIARLASPNRTGGIRNAAEKSSIVRDLAAEGPPAYLARSVLGSAARPVKVTVFDKTSAANWKVPWHQDLTIAVCERREAEGFGPWTIKDGVPHVQPPIEILAGMLAVRVHLDDTTAENGALRMIPGSHLRGRLSQEEVSRLRDEVGEVVCIVPEGGALLMRPLILHASSAAGTARHRRVIHIEYAAACLPFGLEWT